MIIQLLCSPFTLLVNAIIGVLPTFQTIGDTTAELIHMISTALQFFPSDVWILAFSSIIFWLTVRTTMAILFFVLDIIVGIIP